MANIPDPFKVPLSGSYMLTAGELYRKYDGCPHCVRAHLFWQTAYFRKGRQPITLSLEKWGKVLECSNVTVQKTLRKVISNGYITRSKKGSPTGAYSYSWGPNLVDESDSQSDSVFSHYARACNNRSNSININIDNLLGRIRLPRKTNFNTQQGRSSTFACGPSLVVTSPDSSNTHINGTCVTM